jgi:hypothetical protein
MSEERGSRGPRKSDRIELSVPVEIVGLGPDGQTFAEKTSTLNVGRHGAMLQLAQKLFPEQDLTVRKPDADPIEAMVVGMTEAGEGRFTYGLVFKDEARNFWGIEFPELTDADKAAARVLLECRACGKRELTYLNEVEMLVFHANRSITRHCGKCAASTSWVRAEHDAWVGPPPEQAAETEKIDGRSIKRKHTRVKLRMEVCVRTLEHGDDVARLDDICSGGFGFRSRKRYVKNQRVEAATNYHKGAPNIFVPARITSAGKPGNDEFARYGVAYLSEEDASPRKREAGAKA